MPESKQDQPHGPGAAQDFYAGKVCPLTREECLRSQCAWWSSEDDDGECVVVITESNTAPCNHEWEMDPGCPFLNDTCTGPSCSLWFEDQCAIVKIAKALTRQRGPAGT